MYCLGPILESVDYWVIIMTWLFAPACFFLMKSRVDIASIQLRGAKRPVFLWEDEAHYFTIEQDALFQTTARSKGISVVRLTQNLPNFLDAYGRDGKHKVDTLLGNYATKI